MKMRERAIWLIVYLLTMAAVAYGILNIRERTLTAMNSPQARAEWEEWRDEATKQSTEGPVRRRVPRSAEPPALVLMRDYFRIMFAAGLFFSTLLFISMAWLVRGVVMRKI